MCCQTVCYYTIPNTLCACFLHTQEPPHSRYPVGHAPTIRRPIMTMEVVDMTDDTINELRASGWIIKAPFFRDGQAVFLVIKLPA